MKTKHHSILSAPVTQSGDQTQDNPIRPRWFALGLGGLVFTVLFALSASPAQAECSRWDVSGQWELRQTDGIIFQLNLQPGNWQGTSANLTGTATLKNTPASKGYFAGPVSAGVISGGITDNAFTMKIMFGEAQFHFTGRVGPSGKIEGTNKRGVKWVSSRGMKCADANPPISKQKTGAANPPPSTEAHQSSSSDMQDQHKKNKKNETQFNWSGTKINSPPKPVKTTSTSSTQAEESSSSDTEDQPKKKKKKKNKKKHHQDDDDENQGND